MLGTFSGLNIASLGLSANQSLLEVTAQNVDNANTPGYSRQVAQLSTTPEISVPGAGPINMQVGTGVQVADISRIRNAFLDAQYRNQNAGLGQATVMQNTMNKISAIVNEPSNTGLSAAMQKFWTAWSQLGSNPGDLSAQTELNQAAQSVTSTMNQMGTQYTQLSSDLQTQLKDTTVQANSDIKQIADLNKQIQAIQSTGGQPNDLMDKRDLLLDKLSNLADVKTSTGADGSLQVSVGGTLAVSGDTVKASLAVPGATPSASDIPLSSVAGGQIKGLEDSLQKVQAYSNDLNTFVNHLANGSMNVKLAGSWQIPVNTAGQFTVSGTLPDGTAFKAGDPISSFTTAPAGKPDDKVTVDNSVSPNGLVTIPAGTVIDNVQGLNGLLKLGYAQDGQVDPTVADPNASPTSALPDFFVPTQQSGSSTMTASNITVGASAGQIGFALRPLLRVDASGTKIFSTSDPALSGDGTLAITATDMQNAAMTFQSANPNADMTGTLGEFWQGEVGQLGIDAQQANNQVTNQTNLLQQVNQQRQSISGVNLDEEMTNMIKYQQGYTASAKIISAINGMLTSLMQEVQ